MVNVRPFWKFRQLLGGWRGLAYSMFALPWGIVTFTLTVVFWSVAVGMTLFPLGAIWIPETATGGSTGTKAREIRYG